MECAATRKEDRFVSTAMALLKTPIIKTRTRKNGQIGTPIGSHQDAVKLNLVDVIQPVISRSTFAYCLFHLALANYLAHIWSPKTRFNKQNHKLNLDINQRLRFRSLFWPDNWKTKI